MTICTLQACNHKCTGVLLALCTTGHPGPGAYVCAEARITLQTLLTCAPTTRRCAHRRVNAPQRQVDAPARGICCQQQQRLQQARSMVCRHMTSDDVCVVPRTAAAALQESLLAKVALQAQSPTPTQWTSDQKGECCLLAEADQHATGPACNST